MARTRTSAPSGERRNAAPVPPRISAGQPYSAAVGPGALVSSLIGAPGIPRCRGAVARRRAGPGQRGSAQDGEGLTTILRAEEPEGGGRAGVAGGQDAQGAI